MAFSEPNKKVTVIVPVYGAEQYLDECIRSISDQTYKNLEIILVDDGSKDRCPEIVDSWALLDSRIRVVHQENQGVSVARNRALDMATGDYLAFVDSDDHIDTKMIERMVAYLEEYDVDMVNCQFYRQYDTRIEKAHPDYDEEPRVLDPSEAVSILLDEKIFTNYFFTKLIKAEVFEGIRFPVGRFFEDAATMHKVIAACNKICLVKDNFCYYRILDNSVSHTKSLKNIGDALWAAEYCHEGVVELFPEHKVKTDILYIKRLYRDYFDLREKCTSKGTTEHKAMLKKTHSLLQRAALSYRGPGRLKYLSYSFPALRYFLGRLVRII